MAALGSIFSNVGSALSSCLRFATNSRATSARDASVRALAAPTALSSAAEAPITARRRSPLTCKRSATGLSDIKSSLEVGRLIKRPDFDLARSGHGVGATLHPCDRFVHVRNLPQPEAGDHFLGLGKRPVGDQPACAVEG